MGDYTLQTIEPNHARPDLTFTKAQCKHCPYVSQRGYAGYAQSSMLEHLRDKHKIYKAQRHWERKR